MKPPKINTLEADVEFYLYLCSFPRMHGDLRDVVRREMDETYGKESVEIEIARQKS